ncbi:hypothetical protein [Rhodococcus sp. P1Y]|nr:hypothetical protein [Rhodococcus sp. P1Y]
MLPEHFSVDRTFWIAAPRELVGLARVRAVDELLSAVVKDAPHLSASL